jgi:uncharacterized membrane protein
MHISERIGRPAGEVYEYAVDRANLPEWARGLGSAVENVTFVERNAFGVLDHEVTLPSGEMVYVPMRVLPDGDSSEVVFTLRRSPGMSDQDLERDAQAVAADLARLKEIVEGRNRTSAS